MENNSNLYTINTTTGAATQARIFDSNGYSISPCSFSNTATYYVAAGSGLTINVSTGQMILLVFRTDRVPVALAPDPLITATPTIKLVANAEGGVATITPNTWAEIQGSNLGPAGDTRIWGNPDFAGGQLPTSLDGLSVTVNRVPAYVYYISPAQVNISASDTISGSVPIPGLRQWSDQRKIHGAGAGGISRVLRLRRRTLYCGHPRPTEVTSVNQSVCRFDHSRPARRDNRDVRQRFRIHVDTGGERVRNAVGNVIANAGDHHRRRGCDGNLRRPGYRASFSSTS